MDNEKKYTERDLILAKREAFDVGVSAVWSRFNLGEFASGRGWEGTEELAARRYPLPKVTRPRVVRDERDGKRRDFRISLEGQFQTRSVLYPDRGWQCIEEGLVINEDWGGNALAIDAERVKLWADLLANPTEEVEQSDV